MSHLDEGQLHALLDGEMDDAERIAAEAHLASCPECRREYAEARTFLAEADQLIAAVDLPAQDRAVTTAAGKAPPRFMWRNLAWAASLVAAVGLGWMARADQFRAGQDRVEQPTLVAPSAAGSLDLQPEEDKAKQEQDERPLPASAPSLADKTEPSRKPARQGDSGTGSTATEARPPVLAQAPAGEHEPVPAQDALRGLTNPVTPRPDLARAKSADPSAEHGPVSSKVVAEEGAANRPDRPVANAVAPAPPAASPAPRDAELGRTGGLGLAAPAPAGRRDRTSAGFQVTPMEEAVRILGGSIRLLDGMTPTRVEVGAGHLVAGADSGLEIVRVVYNDPPGRELWLDQQRPAEQAGDAEVQGQRATTLLPGDTLLTPGRTGPGSLRWIHQTGFRLGLTGFLPADSLRALARRIQ
jgi:Putative zinc-finger